jgi:methionine synthase / methylenetetrahydrofolate reductase(NADPH)
MGSTLPPLSELLTEHVLVADGAMGTQFYERGVFLNTCYDQLNLTRGELVLEVHRAYVQAGAELIQTNTYGANRVKLGGHGLEEQLVAVNRRGVELAREAAGNRVYVGGSVGPLGIRIEPLGPTSREEACACFAEQINVLAEAGVDLIVLETFSDLSEILEALRAARQVCELPVMAQMTCREDGSTLLGTPAEVFGVELDRAGADIIGVNHSDGPAGMLGTIQRLAAVTRKPLSAQPNAGLPKSVEGRNIYLTTPEYLASYARRFIQAGASVVGGCCGTSPAHIKTIKGAVRMLKPAHPLLPEPAVYPSSPTRHEIPVADRSGLALRITAGQWVICAELVPPRGPDPGAVLQAAAELKQCGVHAINIPDGPRASARMGAQALALLIQQQADIEAVLHYTCRDRNLLAMQSDLLGLDALGVHNILIITGDPPKLGDYPDATAVYDIDSIGLTNVVRMLNRGRDVGGRDLGTTTALFNGVGCNPGAINMAEELRRFRYKVEAGACFAVTQPVFDLGQLESFLEQIHDLAIPIVVGLWPLLSLRNAEFMHHEVPGVRIPEGVMQRMADAPDAGSARAEGVAIARELLERVRPLVQGVQISAPMGLYEQVIQVMS